MRLSSISTITITFLIAAILCWITAGFAVTAIEDGSKRAVRTAFDDSGMPWVEVDADGLQVFLAGTAPSEAARFNALSTAGTVVDSARVIDQMLVEETADIAPPRFSVEILRNDSGVSLIGLIPASTDRDKMLAKLRKLAGDAPVKDLLEIADFPEPEYWQAALDFGLRALKELPRSKISVAADAVRITAMVDSGDEKRRLEADFARKAPAPIRLALDISAPRPVITPFTLRFLIEDGNARFDACSADTPEARDRILAAAAKAGLEGKADCTIGLGVPSPKWSVAAERAVAAVAELGGGTVTFSDADISLVALEGTEQAHFDTVVGALESALPEVFTLHAVLPEPPAATTQGPIEFISTLSPEGLVQIRGRLNSEVSRKAVVSFARARFGSEAVHSTARVDETLPKAWALRVLTGLEALAHLSNGAVRITPDTLDVSGATGDTNTSAEIAQFLSDKLGEGAQFTIDVTYKEQLDPALSIPTPDECEAEIAEILVNRKINFEPGSAKIDETGAEVMNDIAEILRDCGEIRMEIGGHTDSQGRESMNQQLSQQRANAVLNELRVRRILTSSFTAKGYGESQPIADNKSEDGREANRRIEFRLIRPKPIKETQTTLESIAASGAEEAAPGDEVEDAPAPAGEEQQEDTPDEQN